MFAVVCRPRRPSKLLVHLFSRDFGNIVGVVPEQGRQTLQINPTVRLTFVKLLFNGGHERVHGRRLDQIIINLASDRLQRRFKSRVTRQDQGYTFWLSPAHCADDRETIARMTDVEIRDENVVRRLVHRIQRFGNRPGSSHLEAMDGQHSRKREPNSWFVIYEKNTGSQGSLLTGEQDIRTSVVWMRVFAVNGRAVLGFLPGILGSRWK